MVWLVSHRAFGVVFSFEAQIDLVDWLRGASQWHRAIVDTFRREVDDFVFLEAENCAINCHTLLLLAYKHHFHGPVIRVKIWKSIILIEVEISPNLIIDPFQPVQQEFTLIPII